MKICIILHTDMILIGIVVDNENTDCCQNTINNCYYYFISIYLIHFNAQYNLLFYVFKTIINFDLYYYILISLYKCVKRVLLNNHR